MEMKARQNARNIPREVTGSLLSSQKLFIQSPGGAKYGQWPLRAKKLNLNDLDAEHNVPFV